MGKTKGTGSKEKEVDLNDEEELNVYFMHNGHLWDAHDLMGVPAGSSMEEIEKAYGTIMGKGVEENKEMIQRAYEAICEKTNST